MHINMGSATGAVARRGAQALDQALDQTLDQALDT